MEAGETKYILLPDDLLEGVFSRLTVKDLLRIRSVCRAWCALIDDSSFILMHHRAQCAMHKADGDVPLLLWFHSFNSLTRRDEYYLLSKHQGHDVLLDLTSDIERDRNSALTVDPNIRLIVKCIGTANGIVCFDILLYDEKRRYFECRFGLWNPATRDFKIVAFAEAPDQWLPHWGGGHRVVGFMYDALSNDFKVMATSCIVCEDDSYINLAYDIYSLSTNSWKRLTDQPIYLGAKGLGLALVSGSIMDVFVNGVNYWIASLSSADVSKSWILSFHLSSETFKLSDAPQGAVQPCVDFWPCIWAIGLYKEFVALYVIQNLEQVGSIDIWVVAEFDNLGAPIAWQCLFVVAPIHVHHFPNVVGSRVDGEILVKIDNDMLKVYDPRTSMFRDVNVEVHRCFSYVESLFPLSRRVIRH